MENETFTTELASNGTISQDLAAQMAWERERQLARTKWERRHNREDAQAQGLEYRKPAGSAVSLPMKPKARKGR